MVLLVWVEVIGMLVVVRAVGVVVVVVLSDDDVAVLITVMVKETDLEGAAWEDAAVLVEHTADLVVLPLPTDPVV